jgi:cytochrome c oxidase subunit 2
MTNAVTSPPPTPGAVRAPGVPDGHHHFRWMIGIWLVLMAAGEPIIYFVVGPHVPPGTMTTDAAGAQFDFYVLLMIALPVLLVVWIYLGYAIWTWRASRGGPEPVIGPYSWGHLGIQVGWILSSTAIVLGLFAFGTYELADASGAGGGQGPNPLFTPTAHKILPVQVIAQQWLFTYRYPTFGSFETNQLVIPANTEIAFHVTSLDVVHDFWAYQLGVKADANPDYDNIAYTHTTDQLGAFTVRCDELCGIWHGAMYDTGQVMSGPDFTKWAASNEKVLAAATKLLPPFAWTYTPDANGADGGYYPDNLDPYSNVEVYGAQTVKL